MARPRRFALALLCTTAAVAGGCAASLGGFGGSGRENPATLIWNGGAAGGATVASADAGPLRALLVHAIASVAAVTTSHRELPEPALASAAAPAADAATVDPGPRETAFGVAGVSAAEAPVVEAPSPDSRPTSPSEKRVRVVSLFRPDPVEEEAHAAAPPVQPL